MSDRLVFCQGISFVGAALILVFQSVQTYVVDTFTLHAASGTSCRLSTSCDWAILIIMWHVWYSPSRCLMPSLPCRLRIPLVCSCYVRQTGLRKGKHNPRVSSYWHGMPCVSRVHSIALRLNDSMEAFLQSFFAMEVW